MSERDVKNVAAKLKKFMVGRDYSQASVARKLGVSSSQISQFLAGIYKGDLSTLTKAVVCFINDESRQKYRVKREGYVKTSVAEKIAAIIDHTIGFSDEEAKIGLIIGDGGHGKSLCLKQYNSTHPTSIYIELDSAMNARYIFAELCKKLKMETSGSLPVVSRRLIESLSGRHIIVLLDEASYLKIKQLDQLRQVITVKCHCPLILAGNRELYKTVMRPIDYLDQFTSRLMQVLDLDELASRDGPGGLYSAEDIRKLYQFGGIKLTSDGVAALRNICKSPRSGRLRTCTHIINALHTADVVSQSGKINADLIWSAIDQLELPVRVRLPMAARDAHHDTESESIAAAG